MTLNGCSCKLVLVAVSLLLSIALVATAPATARQPRQDSDDGTETIVSTAPACLALAPCLLHCVTFFLFFFLHACIQSVEQLSKNINGNFTKYEKVITAIETTCAVYKQFKRLNESELNQDALLNTTWIYIQHTLFSGCNYVSSTNILAVTLFCSYF